MNLNNFNTTARAENEATAKKIAEKEIAHPEEKYSSVSLKRNYDVDVLSQFRTNLEQVEDLSARLRFNLGEVSQLITKRR